MLHCDDALDRICISKSKAATKEIDVICVINLIGPFLCT